MISVSFEESIDSISHIKDEVDVIDLFRQFKDVEAASNSELMLISGATFNAPDTKKKEAIEQVSCVFFDFDGSSVSPAIISAHYSQYEHCVYNSFNNGIKGTGERFRVTIPLASPVAASHYEHLWLFLAQPFLGDQYQLDIGKRSAASWFRVPSKTNNPIWIENAAPTLEPDAVFKSSDFAAYIQNAKAVTAIEAPPPVDRSTLTVDDKAIRIEKALEKFAGADGHDGFFKFACSLKNYLEPNEINAVMRQYAGQFGTSTSDRIKEIPSIIQRIGSLK